MSHQDFKVIYIGNPDKQKLNRTIINRKGDTTNIDRIHKIENETENFTIQKIPSLLSREIINIRVQSKLSQKDVANKLQTPLNIYTKLENGSAFYIPETKQLINKLERIFGSRFVNK